MPTQTFKTSEAEIAAYGRASKASGMSKSVWIRFVLAVASGVPFLLETKIEIPDHEAVSHTSNAELTQSFKVTSEEMDAYKIAALAAIQKRSVWVRLILAAASGLSDIPSQMARVANVQNKPVTDGEW